MGTAASVPGIEGEQEFNPEGHTTRIVKTLKFFGSRLPFVFEQSFVFQCQENPTSWSLQATFYRVPTDGTVTCEIAIRKIDNTPVAMGTDFWMRPILPFPFPDLCTLNLRAEGVFPNHKGRRIIQFMPNEAMTQLGNRSLQLEMFFRIRRCHRDMLSAGLFGAVYQERFRPPTLFEEMYIEELPQRQ